MQLADFLSRKSMFPVIRKGLNLLFCASITSFLFEKYYFNYSWIEITDYKSILNFFIKGNYIVPFCIFIVIFLITYFIPYTIFAVPNYFKGIKWRRKILGYKLSKFEAESQFEKIKSETTKNTALQLSSKAMFQIYKDIRNSFDEKQYQQIQRKLEKQKDNLLANFIFAFRALITIFIYFITIEYFGFFLFTIVNLSIILYMVLLVFSYRFLDLIPTFIGKIALELDKYVRFNEK